ncbi:transmembrane protein 183 [Bradysia coprophila]|uniref:transmembrane protein 183 n=1 Tax=Bradysia coprophila TaxID=38358 RepID=UPI00187DC27A|nr:transmembrane protein 183 [Bradysia coprophila]
MPKKGRKSRNHKIGDVTIKEFADSNTSTNRPKKGALGLGVKEKILDTLADNVVDDEDLDEAKMLKKRTKPGNTTDEGHVYSNYPVDIWFSIAQRIHPEDVGRFSLICRTTASICASPGFWFSLYKRYFRSAHEKIVPVRLQPDCMVRLHGLRACVIRSLFFTYKPFVDRLPALAQQDFHNLKSLWIVGSWVATDKLDWTFCYKLRAGLATQTDDSERSDGDSLNNFRDIHFNPERGCKVLVVTTTKYCPLPDLRGNTSYVLNSISHTLTTNLRDYRLTLVFSNYQKQKVHSTVITVAYEPVSLVQVLDWWTPAYNELK